MLIKQIIFLSFFIEVQRCTLMISNNNYFEFLQVTSIKIIRNKQA